jgi:peptidoglycan/LPS O-acetylase OafA/YrhL
MCVPKSIYRKTFDMKTKHVGVLDGFRGVAVLAVVAAHFWSIEAGTGLLGWLTAVCGSGWIGVELFFVLSGFLITGILCDNKRTARGWSYFKAFYGRRLVRIFPLYYACLLIAFVIVPAFVPNSFWAHYPDSHELMSETIQNQWWFWAYLSNFYMAHGEGVFFGMGAIWSLAIEEQYYLAWPLLVYLCSTARLTGICGFLLATGFMARVYLATQGRHHEIYMYTFTHLDPIVVGSLLALWVRRDDAFGRRFVGLARWASYGAVGAFVAYTAFVGPVDSMAYWVQIIGFPVIALGCGAMLYTLYAEAQLDQSASWLTRVFDIGALKNVGKYSFAIYLFHFPILRLISTLKLNGFATIALALAATYALSWVSFHGFEKHFLALKKYFPYGPAAKAPGEPITDAPSQTRVVARSPG